jgi:hypothetical protein
MLSSGCEQDNEFKGKAIGSELFMYSISPVVLSHLGFLAGKRDCNAGSFVSNAKPEVQSGHEVCA